MYKIIFICSKKNRSFVDSSAAQTFFSRTCRGAAYRYIKKKKGKEPLQTNKHPRPKQHSKEVRKTSSPSHPPRQQQLASEQ
jgi:hypothetical protein